MRKPGDRILNPNKNIKVTEGKVALTGGSKFTPSDATYYFCAAPADGGAVTSAHIQDLSFTYDEFSIDSEKYWSFSFHHNYDNSDVGTNKYTATATKGVPVPSLLEEGQFDDIDINCENIAQKNWCYGFLRPNTDKRYLSIVNKKAGEPKFIIDTTAKITI